MVQVTIAEAAAVINVAIVLVQLTYPLLVTLVAVGLVKRQTNAATWSVFGRLIHSSYFPFLLRTDTSSTTKVDKRITGISYASTLAGFVLAIAAVVTPLGLRPALRLQDSEETAFTYVKDTSPIGQAGTDRAGYVANRFCKEASGYGDGSCPSNNDFIQVVFNRDGTYENAAMPGHDDAYISTTIAQNLTDVFSGATNVEKGTVSGFFDIQWRSFINYNNATPPRTAEERIRQIDQGRPRTQGRSRYYQQFLLDNQTRAVEGLIVATGETPGIGFRNHTLPTMSEFGSTWTERLLWLEPETACTNLNVTFDYTMPSPDYTSFESNGTNWRLTDRGGIASLPTEFPVIDFNDTQRLPQLLVRSHLAALMTNTLIRRAFNQSRDDTAVGNEYYLHNSSDYSYDLGNPPAPNVVDFSQYGAWVQEDGQWNPNLPGILRIIGNDSFSSVVAAKVSTQIAYGADDRLNIKTIGVKGGLVLGTGRKVDADGNILSAEESFSADPGTNWTQPLYACLSAFKASVKEVDFRLNGSTSVENLAIVAVRPVSYDSQESMPVWGMEETGRNITALDPFWGLVRPEDRDREGLATLQQSEFYVPATGSSLPDAFFGQIDDAMAASQAPFAGLEQLYTASTFVSSTSPFPDYSAATNWLLYRKWAGLSAQAGTTGKIMDLIWTDFMANTVVGSRSVLSGSSASSAANRLRRRADTPSSVNMPAARYELGITYDFLYAIPALVFAALYMFLFAWSAFIFCTRGLSITILRFVLNQTAAGRAMTTERYHASSDVDIARTPVWARIRGDEVVRVSKHNADRGAYSPNGYYALDKPQAQVTSTATDQPVDGYGVEYGQ